ncbi:hypothetical protein J3F84DRAFT_76469 [Trichoderma pleuroticola]
MKKCSLPKKKKKSVGDVDRILRLPKKPTPRIVTASTSEHPMRHQKRSHKRRTYVLSAGNFYSSLLTWPDTPSLVTPYFTLFPSVVFFIKLLVWRVRGRRIGA